MAVMNLMIKDCHIKVDYLQKIIRKNLCLNYNILEIMRIYGGAQKVTYKQSSWNQVGFCF